MTQNKIADMLFKASDDSVSDIEYEPRQEPQEVQRTEEKETLIQEPVNSPPLEVMQEERVTETIPVREEVPQYHQEVVEKRYNTITDGISREIIRRVIWYYDRLGKLSQDDVSLLTKMLKAEKYEDILYELINEDHSLLSRSILFLTRLKKEPRVDRVFSILDNSEDKELIEETGNLIQLVLETSLKSDMSDKVSHFRELEELIESSDEESIMNLLPIGEFLKEE